MNKKYFNVPVYLKDNNARIVEGVIQGDTADLFNIKLYDGTEAFDFTGYSMLILTVIKPDATEYIDTTGEYLDNIDPAEGRMAFTLPPSLTGQAGMHFCSVSIYANGVKLTTARFNYYVQNELSDGSGMIGENEYPVMQKLLAQMALIVDAEQMRAEAEYLRVLQENQRVSETSGIVAKASASEKAAAGYATAAQDWYNLLVNYAGDITGADLNGIATKQELATAIAAIDCGLFGGSVYKALQVMRGDMKNLPTLKDGELGYAKDTKELYIGADGNNELLNGPCFVLQATEPADTSKLWIDTGNGNAIKVFDGNTWVSTSTATFG